MSFLSTCRQLRKYVDSDLWRQIYRHHLSEIRLHVNPFSVIKAFSSQKMLWKEWIPQKLRRLVRYACENGFEKLLDRILTRLPFVYELMEKIATMVARAPFMDMLLRVLKISDFYVSEMLIGACSTGNLPFVELLIDRGARNFDQGLVKASSQGHVEIVRYLIPHCKDFNDAMISGANGNHSEIVRLLWEAGARSFNETMVGASRHGNLDIIELMLANGATSFNDSLITGSEFGHKEVVDLMYRKGATNLGEAFLDAIEHRSEESVDLLLDLGIPVNILNEALIYLADVSGSLTLATSFLDSGATNLNEALEIVFDVPKMNDLIFPMRKLKWSELCI